MDLSDRRHAFMVALVCLASLAMAGCERKAQPERGGAADSGTTPLATTPAAGTPAVAVHDSVLSWVIPHDATFGPGDSTLPTLQHAFDELSWHSFVALNWPALANGSADSTVIIGASDTALTVWETYKESFEVFLPNGAAPTPWGAPRTVPPACLSCCGNNVRMVLRMTQKVSDDVLNFSGQAFNTGPLIDQDSVYVRYEIALNRDAFNYIVTDTLYSKAGQKNVKGIQFPSGGTDTVGAMLIKVAWKVLGPNDKKERFHTIQALVYTPPSTNPPIKETCEVKTMGLVGLHIAHKTGSAPQWVWSTFEQVDNVSVPAGSGLHPSFFNPDCPSCPVNRPPQRPWNPNVPAAPTQVKRVIPITDATVALNTWWQGQLRRANPASVWQYYELVSTQWPTNPSASPTGPNRNGNPAPPFLANTAIETYIQGKTPNVSSSCIGCHGNATTTTAVASDFTYLLERAK